MKIAEVSEKYDIPADTLRYYERVGLLPSVHRTTSGIRDYTPEDCGWVEFVKCMRSAGLSIEVLIEYMRLFAEGDSTIPARKQLLIEQREELRRRMDDMQVTLDRLDWKIANYESRIVPASRQVMAGIQGVCENAVSAACAAGDAGATGVVGAGGDAEDVGAADGADVAGVAGAAGDADAAGADTVRTEGSRR